MVSESREIRAPRRAIKSQAADIDTAILEQFCVLKPKLFALQQKVMISANAQDVVGWTLGKPRNSVAKRLLILLPETAKISAMNQNIALGDRDLAVIAMRIGDGADGNRF